jgi:hypothetical protein
MKRTAIIVSRNFGYVSVHNLRGKELSCQFQHVFFVQPPQHAHLSAVTS